MATTSFPLLSNIFSVGQLPTALQILQPSANAVQDVLEKVHYRNFAVQKGSNAYAFAASIVLASPFDKPVKTRVNILATLCK